MRRLARVSARASCRTGLASLMEGIRTRTPGPTNRCTTDSAWRRCSCGPFAPRASARRCGTQRCGRPWSGGRRAVARM
ncbi:unnamed protein product, partial [Effrenium voratum]